MPQPDTPELLVESQHLIDELEIGIHRMRAHIAQRTFWSILMDHLDDLIASGQKLKAERASLLKDRDDEKARADQAEAALADLQKQVADDEAKALAAQQDLDAEVTAEAPQSPVIATTTAPSGASVTTTVDVANGIVTADHTDAATSAQTKLTMNLTTGATSTVDANGAETATIPEAVQLATAAAADQGVTVPAAQ